MPYSHRQTGKNEVTVTKADTGKVVGKTTPGKLNAYLAALHIHSPENKAQGGQIEDNSIISQILAMLSDRNGKGDLRGA